MFTRKQRSLSPRDGKLIVQTWVRHFPAGSFQALEVHANEIKTGLLSPDAEVLLDEKEVSIDEYGVSLKGPLARDYLGKSKDLNLDSK